MHAGRYLEADEVADESVVILHRLRLGEERPCAVQCTILIQ